MAGRDGQAGVVVGAVLSIMPFLTWQEMFAACRKTITPTRWPGGHRPPPLPPKMGR